LGTETSGAKLHHLALSVYTPVVKKVKYSPWWINDFVREGKNPLRFPLPPLSPIFPSAFAINPFFPLPAEKWPPKGEFCRGSAVSSPS